MIRDLTTTRVPVKSLALLSANNAIYAQTVTHYQQARFDVSDFTAVYLIMRMGFFFFCVFSRSHITQIRVIARDIRRAYLCQ